MNSLINKLTTLGKSFYGLIIYFSVSYIFNFVVQFLPKNDLFFNSLYLIGYDLITLIILIIVFRKRLKKDFIDFDNNYRKYLKLGFKVWLLGIIVMVVSNNIIYNYVTNSIASNQATNMAVINKYPFYSVISMIIIGPFVEEIVFRLSFKNALKNKKLYYLLSVLIFTSLHVFNGISSPLDLLFFIPYGSLAIAFSYILDKTDNIFTTTVIHTFHNALTIILISIISII